MDSTPAGWYDDPEQPGRQRFWDGTSWTEQRRDPGDATTSDPAAPPPPSGGMMAPPPAAGDPPPTGPSDPPPPSGGMVAPPPGAGRDAAPGGPTMPPPPTTPPSGSPPPGPAPTPPDPATTAAPSAGPAAHAPPATPGDGGSSRKVLWIVLAVAGVLVVLALVAILAVTFLGTSETATDVVEENLPAELERNFSAQGLDVTVSEVDCDEIPEDEGSFTTPCRITIAGLDGQIEAVITGSITGNTVSVTEATSDTNVLDEDLAVQAAQRTVESLDPTVSVTACDLGATLVLVEDGLQFDCDLDTGETATFEVQGGQLDILGVG